MIKRWSVLAVSAAVGTGFLITSSPAHAAPAAAPAARGAVVAQAPVRCDTHRMRQQIAALKDKAAKLKRLGEPAAARRALAEADALRKKLDACHKAEENAGKPFPG
jgi:hypothetical protein